MIMKEERWRVLEKGITKAELILDGCKMNQLFTAAEYIQYYSCAYDISDFNSYHPSLIDRFKKALEHGIVSKVLPSLMDKDGVHLLTEFLQHWRNYKMMTKCLIRFFDYLDRQIEHREDGSPRLVDFSFCSFHELVCKVLHRRLINAAAFLISDHRYGLQIDEYLLQGISLFFVEFGEHGYKPYYGMFEEEILKDAAKYYYHLALVWYPCYSSTDYVLKVEQCLLEEKRRATKFLQQSSTEKLLLQVVYSQMLEQYADKLAEKQKAEENVDSMLYQDLISRCLNLCLG